MSWRKLGARIKQLRRAQGLTQAALARKARLSLIYVKKLEAGDKTGPSFPALERLARALRVKLIVTLDEED